MGVAGLDLLDKVARGVRERDKRSQPLRGLRASWGSLQGLAQRSSQDAVVLLLFLDNDLLGNGPKFIVAAVARQ